MAFKAFPISITYRPTTPTLSKFYDFSEVDNLLFSSENIETKNFNSKVKQRVVKKVSKTLIIIW